jgi:site-specific DNA-methyltransferase (adenine-specific)
MSAADWCVVQGEAFAELRELEAECIDALVTDPPYSSGGQFKGDRASSVHAKYQTSGVNEENVMPAFTGDNRDQRSFLAWCTLWLSECFRVLKAGAPIVLFTDWRQLPITTDALQAGGFTWRGVAPWMKTTARPRIGGFSAMAEYVVWGSKGALPPRDDVGCLRGAWHAPKVHHTSRLHLTEKPLEVMRGCVKICPPGGIVLDPFAGSGSTGHAALLEGRRFLGFELSPEYHAIACQRLETVAGSLLRQRPPDEAGP